ncbi:hypothetical protein V6259_13085 [Marinomonas sp. TI.3.20]|uniref:hypothetical protein n=1 Tax=Marinomonas sp. TI.3.20 TaxID=3121296 RepID=UPI00311E04A1
MITSQELSEALDALFGPSHSLRVWTGRISKRQQEKFFGLSFGDVTLCLSEVDSVILALKPHKQGPFLHDGKHFRSIAKYNIKKPLLSHAYLKNSTCYKAIYSLMNAYKTAKQQYY